MNFEIFDNWFQVLMMLTGAAYAGYSAWKMNAAASGQGADGETELQLKMEKYSRICITLAFAYLSFMLGTMFYVMYLTVFSYITRTFFVSEVSWTAAYLFFISVELMRTEGKNNKKFTYMVFIPVIIAVLLYRFLYWYNQKLPFARAAFLIVLVFMLMVLAILAIRGIHMNRAAGRSARIDISFLVQTVLQILLYVASGFTEDYTQFNIYFAIDIMITLNLVSIAQALKSEGMREAGAV